MPLPDLPRRRQALTLAVMALLTGCASAPAPAPALSMPTGYGLTPEQRRTLRSLGFVEDGSDWALSLGSRVLFAFGVDRLGPDEVDAVTRLTAALLDAGLRQVRVEGHTDNIGDTPLNLRLSVRRAEVVAREMERRGFPAAGLQVRGFGATRPIADNDTDAGRAQNRRVVVIVRSE